MRSAVDAIGPVGLHHFTAPRTENVLCFREPAVVLGFSTSCKRFVGWVVTKSPPGEEEGVISRIRGGMDVRGQLRPSLLGRRGRHFCDRGGSRTYVGRWARTHTHTHTHSDARVPGVKQFVVIGFLSIHELIMVHHY